MSLSFGFIIASCIRNEINMNSLIKCIETIRLYHPLEKIVLIMDFTSDPFFIEKIIKISFILVEYDKSLKVPADMLTYFYFKKNKYFDIAITLQDSMYLNDKFIINQTDNIHYIWHFTNHRIDWSSILEPVNDFSEKNNIINHDDLVKYCINNFIDNYDLKMYSLNEYEKKQNWIGCFGCLTIMSYDFCIDFDKKTNFINLMMKMTNNRLRRAIESIFSILCEYTLGDKISGSYDGLYYDGLGYHNNFKGKIVSKLSFDRQ